MLAWISEAAEETEGRKRLKFELGGRTVYLNSEGHSPSLWNGCPPRGKEILEVYLGGLWNWAR